MSEQTPNNNQEENVVRNTAVENLFKEFNKELKSYTFPEKLNGEDLTIYWRPAGSAIEEYKAQEMNKTGDGMETIAWSVKHRVRNADGSLMFEGIETSDINTQIANWRVQRMGALVGNISVEVAEQMYANPEELGEKASEITQELLDLGMDEFMDEDRNKTEDNIRDALETKKLAASQKNYRLEDEIKK